MNDFVPITRRPDPEINGVSLSMAFSTIGALMEHIQEHHRDTLSEMLEAFNLTHLDRSIQEANEIANVEYDMLSPIAIAEELKSTVSLLRQTRKVYENTQVTDAKSKITLLLKINSLMSVVTKQVVSVQDIEETNRIKKAILTYAKTLTVKESEKLMSIISAELSTEHGAED